MWIVSTSSPLDPSHDNLPLFIRVLFFLPSALSFALRYSTEKQIYNSPISKWTALKNRRLQNWGGVVHEKGLLPQALPPWLTKITERIYKDTGLFPSAINHVLINEYFPDQGIMPHQDGPAYFPVAAILSLGCPAVMNFSPHLKLTACNDVARNTEIDTDFVSLKDDLNNDISSNHHCPFSVLLTPCSLLIFKDEAYLDYLHGIEDTTVHHLDNVVNTFEAMKQHKNSCLLGSEDRVEARSTDPIMSIQRTSTRISLTCRLVSKVHKNLFKF
ncbi:hypothetical protein IFM89_038125 [Coptis chinensis]|uniref:Fe2OG dioxygenase domain-containing protein n=1 Tax=Coptis chinensis TaxID=261450 RepID=A0A835HTB2_9MAGN|nr:hypothetical protein IFM89_038125 [Coptis chinensis]